MKKRITQLLALGIILLPHVAQATVLTNPLGTTSISRIIGRVISAVLGITGAVALLMFVWGGFQWLIAAGSPDRIKKGKDTLMWSAIGLAVIVGAYALVNTIVTALETGSVTG